MLDTIKMKLWQKNQYIPDIKNAKMKESFRGLPVLNDDFCKHCGSCQKICPTGALNTNPLSIDLSKCTFCGACERVCKNNGCKCDKEEISNDNCKNCAITFSNFYKLGVDKKDKLIIDKNTTSETYYNRAIEVREEIYKIFNRSIKFRQVSAGGCNGCEMELNAASNANFDMGRFGIDFVASPRHADGIVITGPITKNMAYALENCYKSTPDPKVVILVGACALSGGIFQNSNQLNREFLDKYKVDLYIPGCPVHPLTFINAVLDFIRKK